MANRQALRELQERLAGRLQAARAQGASASWLAVEAGGSRYVVPLGHAGEIFPFAAAQPVPYTQGWFLGVANLRGGLYGVVDLASFVTGAAPKARSELGLNESRLLTLNPTTEFNCALLIDKLAGLKNEESFVRTEMVGDDQSAMARKLIDSQGLDWLELDLVKLAAETKFLSIAI
jgi:twitching motility protein PilI